MGRQATIGRNGSIRDVDRVREMIRRRWQLRAGFVLVPLGHAAGQNVVNLLAFRFLTDNLAISAGATGLMFACVKIYDGLLDPAVGAWSDRLKTPWGRRLPVLFAGGMLMPLGIVMVFNTPHFSSIVLAELFVTLGLIIHASAYTALTIPGLAMLVEATDDYHERTSLMAYRNFGNSLGVLLGFALPAWLLGYWGANRSGHAMMAAVVAGIVLVACLTAVWLLRHAPRTQPAPIAGMAKPYSFWRQVHLAWANRPFRILAITHVFILVGTSVPFGCAVFFSKYVLLKPDALVGTFFLLTTVGSIGAMPLWVGVCRRIGKKRAYMAAMALYGLVFLAWLSATPTESNWLLSLRAIMSGACASGLIMCAYSMLSDAVRYDYIISGMRREGAFSGFTTLFDKLSTAAGLAAMGGLLQTMGYISSTSGKIAQPASAIQAIDICVAIVPALAMAAGIVTMIGFGLNEDDLTEPER